MWIFLTAARAEPQTEISVATINTWGLPAPVAVDRRGRLPRIASWLTEKSYDVAGLEELWQGARRWFPLRDLVFPQQRGDSGLAIATSWPVLDTHSHVFTAERGFDTWKAKGLLVAELEIDGTPVLFGVTHLQAGDSSRNASVRAEQVEEIITWIDDTADIPIILLGDFNLYDGEPIDTLTRDRMESSGFIDAAHATGTLGGTYPGYSDRFDRIYVRQSDKTALVPARSEVIDKGFSDHHAVEAILEIEHTTP